MHASAWMNHENNMLSERNLSQKATYCIIPFMWNIQNRQFRRGRKLIDDCIVLNGWVPTKGYEFAFWGNENILKLIVVMAVQLCDYTQNPWIIHL